MGRRTLSWGAEPYHGAGTLPFGAEPNNKVRNPITGREPTIGCGTYNEVGNPITGRGTLSWGAVPCFGALITKS